MRQKDKSKSKKQETKHIIDEVLLVFALWIQ